MSTSTAPSGGTEGPAPARPEPAVSRIALGAAVTALTLLVYQWVLFAAGIPRRMFFPIVALVTAQAMFNGVVLARCVGELQAVDARAHDTALRWMSMVLGCALLAMSGFQPLLLAGFVGNKTSDLAWILAIGGLTAGAVLAIVVAPALYALAARLRKDPRVSP